jgi:hypothetical protein
MKIVFRVALYGFAGVGVIVCLFVVIHKTGVFNVSGTTDPRSELFLLTKNQLDNATKSISSSSQQTTTPQGYSGKLVSCMLQTLSQKYPSTADRIYAYYESTGNIDNTYAMLIAVTTTENALQSQYEQCAESSKRTYNRPETEAYAWLQSAEWNVLKTALTRDQEALLRASKDSGVPVRILIGPIIGEQLRYYTSARSVFKSYLQPQNSFIHLSQFSHGVAGLKPETAERIESLLRAKDSPWYIGSEYENILDYPSNTYDISSERMNRISNRTDHYYAYLYVGLYLRQFMAQWQSQGYDISNRPEILATLYNLGHNRSIPKPNPAAGGAPITINDKTYTFGGLAYDFYWSGELQEIFPY